MATGAVALAGGPIGLGITAGVGGLSSVLGLFTQHSARYRGAKNENDGVGVAVGVFDQDMQGIFSALNSGSITEQQALTYLEATRQAFWQYMSQFQGQPGVFSRPATITKAGGPVGHGACDAGPACDKTCTAGCCVGYNDVEGSIANAKWAISAGGGTFSVCEVFPSPGIYAFPGRKGYTLTYTKPAGLVGVKNGALGILDSLGITAPSLSSTGTPLPPNLVAVQQEAIATTAKKSIVGIGAFLVVGFFGLFILPKITH